MDNHPSHSAEGMDTSTSPLDLSIRRGADMLDALPKSPQGFWARSLRALEPLKEMKLENTKQPSALKNGSCQDPRLYKDQTCLPLRKRKFPLLPKEEATAAKRANDYSEWKFCSPPYMAVTLPPLSPYYSGNTACLPHTLYPTPSPVVLESSHLRLMAPYHATLVPTETDLHADLIAATQTDEDGDTALHIAVAHGNLSIAQRVLSILNHGRRDIDVLNNLRQTPLHLAVITDQPEFVALLLQHRASPLILDRNGQTCVHLACEYGSMGSLEVLMRAGIRDLEATNYHGMTALHVAVRSGRRDITACLLEHGADVNAVDLKSGQSPLIQAVENGSEELVSLLLQKGAEVNGLTYAGNTALHVASGRGLTEIARILLRSGADSSIKNCHNDTAMTVAKDRKIVDILRGKSSSPRSQNERLRGSFKGRSCSPTSPGVTSGNISVSPPP
ncbi:B-cell lymphoma 3 protein isoform X2 [Hyla sarda]|uniref:B-cell lymphoma 3 protein isoform X2 n=1 Tax=Hyla sarda TaxID=327740 RepID=UPI0024C35F58|nr:B-cell lymphoma 3 protein isoform X2 [Hyla sarda]